MKAFFICLWIILCVSAVSAETKKFYYPDGKLKAAISYKDGKKNGAEHLYYPDGATLRSAKNFVYGRLHGLSQEYRPNATIIREVNYRHGVREGKSRSYDENGLLQSEAEYRNGELDGVFREFYPSGVVKVETFWNKGRILNGYRYSEDGSRRVPLKPDELKLFQASNSAQHPTGQNKR